MSNRRLASYAEILEVLEKLPMIVRENRRRRRLSLRAAAEQMGISFQSVARLELGEGVTLETALAALAWLAVDKEKHE